MKNLKIIPDVLTNPTVCPVSVTATVELAARKMTKHEVSAVAVVDDAERLCGILTERDVIRRVVAAGLDARETGIEDVMTRNPDTLAPGDSALDALELMRIRNLGNLPVVEDGRVVGVVSVTDLCRVVSQEMDEGIRRAQALLFGDKYGE
jgi:CBS domain-containing protein